MKRIVYTFLIFSSLISPTISAQSYLGVANSNYAGIMGADIQPASIVDSRFRWDLNLFSLDVTAWQNVYKFDTKDMPGWWNKSFKTGNNAWTKPDSTFQQRYFEEIKSFTDPNASPRGAYFNGQFDILNFFFHVNRKIAVGVSIKARTIVNADNLQTRVLKLATEDLNYVPFHNIDIPDEFIRVNAMAWTEYGLNYAQVLKDDGEHFFKIGGRAKLLQGAGAAYIYSKDFSFRLYNKDTTAQLKGNFNYGYSENSGYDNVNDLNSFIKATSFGFGADLGVVYEWRPEYDKFKYEMDGVANLWRRDAEKYKLRLGASIVDLGGIRYKKGGLSRDFTVNQTSGFTSLIPFSKINSLEDLDSLIDEKTSAGNSEWKANSDNGYFYMNTPTALNLQASYHIWNHFHVNVSGQFGLRLKNDPSRVTVPNQLTITPGYDHPWFGIYVPFQINKYSGPTFGLATRLGPLTFGIQSLNALFAMGKVRGVSIYTGLRVPVLYGHPDDKDKDKVSDRKDECPEMPGLWSFKGCPDTDGDGIKDVDDECPTVAGLKEFKGCPDRDGDGIIDTKDKCPDVKGLITLQGCPDADNDGITDKEDDCPNVSGLPTFRGCPDTDLDGIRDIDDACPEAAGPIGNNGCPDTDNDGIYDFLDGCPTVYGPKENKGCPWPDTDKDGLLDKDDKCPEQAGPAQNQGCPFGDIDGDGVIDKDDGCPNTPGPVSNKGCPIVEAAIVEILKTAFEDLEFNTGNAIIKDVSYKSLNELAEVLVKKPEWKLKIAGHTDSKGVPKANLKLSKQRAEAVKAYLISKGVKAENLIVEFYGQTKPIADNKTEAGRQKNRRVNMTLVFK